jgi:hypothetical protein
MTPPQYNTRDQMSAILGVTLCLVLAMLVSWTIIDPVKYPIAEYLIGSGKNTGLPGFVASLLRPWQWALLSLLVAAISAVFIGELRRHAVSRALSGLNRNQAVILLGALLLWFGHAYLNPGWLLAGDAGSHIARTAHLRMGLEAGNLIAWDNYFYGGETALQFTGPLYFWLSAGMDLLLHDPNLTTKILLLLTHLGGGFAMYALVRRFEISRFAALIGSVIYSGTYTHLHLLVWESAYPQALSLLLLPLALLLVEKFLRERVWFGFTWLGLTLVDAALIVNHQATGVYIAVFVALYVMLSFGLGRAPWTRLAPLVASAGFSVAIGLFCIIPVLAEKSWVMLYDHPASLFRIEWPDSAYWLGLLRWANGDLRHASSSYIGISTIALAGFGIWQGLVSEQMRDYRKTVMALTACVLVAMVLRGSHVRHEIVLLGLLALLASVGIESLVTRPRRWSATHAILGLLVLLDLGPTAIQPLARTDKDYLNAGGEWLEKNAPNERALLAVAHDGKLAIPIGPGGPPVLYHRVPLLTGAHNLAATRVHNYFAAVIMMAENDLRTQGRLQPETAALLAMLNTSRVVADNGRGFGLPAHVVSTSVEGPLGATLRVRDATPVIFAQGLVMIESPPGLDKPVVWYESFNTSDAASQTAKLIEFVRSTFGQMAYEPASRTAERIPVRSAPAASPGSPAPTSWHGAITNYRIGFETIKLDLDSSLAGWVQLAHPWYPGQRVRWNGSIIEPNQGTFNLLVVPVMAGTNSYEVTYPRSSLRQVVNGVSAFALIAALGIVVVGQRSRQRQTRVKHDPA